MTSNIHHSLKEQRILNTASLKPKWVSVKVPRKGALNIEIGRYGDSKNGFG